MSKELTPEEIVSEMRRVVVRFAGELGAMSGLASDKDAIPEESATDIEADPELDEIFWAGFDYGEQLKESRKIEK